MNPRYFPSLSVMIGALILCSTAFHNGYPLIYYDTGTYIISGFEGFVPPDRPIMYGLFIRYISLATSLWFVVFTQCVLLSWLIFLTLKHFSGNAKPYLLHLLTVILLTLSTGITLSAAMLIPDIFTAICILCLGLLLFAGQICWLSFTSITITFLFSLTLHNSHRLIFGMTLGILTIARLWRMMRKEPGIIAGRRIAACWLVLLFSWLTVCVVNYSHNKGFRATHSSHVFLVNKFNEMGLLKMYLDKHCGKMFYALCPYTEELPLDFLWDQTSPLYKTGGWEHTEDEYNRLIRDMLSNTEYLKLFLVKCAENSLQQFFQYNARLEQCTTESATYAHRAVRSYFSDGLHDYLTSRQILGVTDFKLLNFFQNIFVLFSFLILTALIFKESLIAAVTSTLRHLLVYILLAILANAVVCGSLTTVDDRFQARVVWLIPMMAVLVVYNVLRHSRLQSAHHDPGRTAPGF